MPVGEEAARRLLRVMREATVQASADMARLRRQRERGERARGEARVQALAERFDRIVVDTLRAMPAGFMRNASDPQVDKLARDLARIRELFILGEGLKELVGGS